MGKESFFQLTRRDLLGLVKSGTRGLVMGSTYLVTGQPIETAIIAGGVATIADGIMRPMFKRIPSRFSDSSDLNSQK